MSTAPGDGKVFDALYERFGVGDYDEAISSKPWHQWRMTEISKIKAVRLKRGVSPVELLEAIEYCAANGIDIRSHLRLYEHLGAAREWTKARDLSAANADLEAEYAKAVEREMAAADSPWLDRLLRASGPARKEVLEQWRAR